VNSSIDAALRERREWMESGPDSNRIQSFLSQRPIRSKHVAEFTRQLAVMVEARLPLARSLALLAEQQKNHKFRGIIRGILKGIEEGKSLSSSLAGHPEAFDPLYVNLVSAGETGGNLESILQQIAIHLEKMVALRRKIITAMTYPAVIVLVAVAAISFLVFGVMPTFADLFMDFETTMPFPARVLISIGNTFKSHWLMILAAAVVLFILGRMIFRTEGFRRLRDKTVFHIPLVGGVVRKTVVARFARTLGSLLSGGVPLLNALDVTARSSGNRLVEGEIHRMKAAASKGEAMEAAMTRSEVFPDLVLQMVAVGEETAEMPAMLKRTAEYYESEVDAAVEALTSVIEPIIIVVLGVVFGGTMIAIYMQIFDLMNAVQ
jgi:type IV pilus assembly protein PilC